MTNVDERLRRTAQHSVGSINRNPAFWGTKAAELQELKDEIGGDLAAVRLEGKWRFLPTPPPARAPWGKHGPSPIYDSDVVYDRNGKLRAWASDAGKGDAPPKGRTGLDWWFSQFLKSDDGVRVMEALKKSIDRCYELQSDAFETEEDSGLSAQSSGQLQVDWRARTKPYRESGAGTPESWAAMKVEFLGLPNGSHIYALASSPYEKHWSLGRRGSLADMEWDRLLDSFEVLASRCAIILGYRTGEAAWLDWLDCLRVDSPLFQPFDNPASGRIEAPYLIQACADECAKLGMRALGEMAAGTPQQQTARLDQVLPRMPKTVGPKREFPVRAAWLNARLHERAWNRNDPSRHGGPDPKTMQKILDGKSVREDVLAKVATALSDVKGLSAVEARDIPQD